MGGGAHGHGGGGGGHHGGGGGHHHHGRHHHHGGPHHHGRHHGPTSSVYIVGTGVGPGYDDTVVYGPSYYVAANRRQPGFFCRCLAAVFVVFAMIVIIIFWLDSDTCGYDDDEPCD